MLNRRGNLIVVSAASGSGKSTLADLVISRHERIERVITCTTRRPRGLERDGVDYYFLTVEEFERRIAAGDFLEYARVHGRNLYGTSRSFVDERLERGLDLLLVIDVQGAEQVRRGMAEATSVFILPPSFASLEERLRKRCMDENHFDEEDLASRLAAARDEVARFREFDYVIINDDLERAASALAAVVTAQRSTAQAQQSRIEEILKSFGLESMHA